MKRQTFTLFAFFICSMLSLGPVLGQRGNTPRTAKAAFDRLPERMERQAPEASTTTRTTRSVTKTQNSVAATVSKPGKEMVYLWDAGAWKLVSTSTYKYTNKGWVEEEAIKVEGLPEETREVFTYNAQGQITKLLEQKKVGTTWVNVAQETSVYNSNGQLTERTLQEFQNGAWVNVGRDLVTYNASGDVTQHTWQEFANNKWNDVGRVQTTYNAQGLITKELTQEFDGTQWQNVEQEVNTYNAQGYPTQEVKEVWEDGAWFREEGTKTTYTFTGNNITAVEEEEWDVDKQAWEKTEKTLLAYNGSTVSEYTEQIWENNSWVNKNKFVNIVWQNANQLMPKSFVMQEWVNNAWANKNRTTYNFNSSGEWTSILTEEFANGAWKNSNQIVWAYDDKGNVTNTKTQNWNGTAWVTLTENNSIYTYESIHLKEEVHQFKGLTDPTLENVSRIVYSDHQAFTVTATDDPELSANTRVYPNPTSKDLKIELSDADVRVASVSLYSITGQKVYEQVTQKAFSAEPISIDVASFSKGMYLLKVLTADNRSITRKVVVE